MFGQFTERARQAVVLAQEEARALEHDHIGTEHMPLGLLREKEGALRRSSRASTSASSACVRTSSGSWEQARSSSPARSRSPRTRRGCSSRRCGRRRHSVTTTSAPSTCCSVPFATPRASPHAPPGLPRRSTDDSQSGAAHADGRGHGPGGPSAGASGVTGATTAHALRAAMDSVDVGLSGGAPQPGTRTGSAARRIADRTMRLGTASTMPFCGMPANTVATTRP